MQCLSVVALRGTASRLSSALHSLRPRKDVSVCGLRNAFCRVCVRECVRARTHEQAVHPAKRELDEVEARLLQVRVQLDVHLRASTRSLLCSAQSGCAVGLPACSTTLVAQCYP